MSATAGRPRNRLRRLAASAANRFPSLVEAYRFVRNPRWQVNLWRDFASTTKSTEFLRAMPGLPQDAPVVLLALYRDDLYETKVGLTLATGLRIRGFKPVVLIPSNRAHRIRRYADIYGLGDVVARDSIPITDAERAACEHTVACLLGGGLDFDTVRGWQYRGRPIGMHVLSTLIRVTFDGSPDPSVATNREQIRRILTQVLHNLVRADRLIDELSPHLLLVEEANYSVNGPVVDAAVDQNVDVIQTIGTWREDALMSKRLTRATRRVDAKSVAPETLERFEQEPWTSELDDELDRDFEARYGAIWTLGRQFQPDTVPRSADQIIAEIGLDPGRPTAVIFAHVLWDASLFFGEDLFQNYADWLVRSVRTAAENPNVNWIVKAHPSNVFRAAHGDVRGESSEVVLIREHLPRLPDHVHVLLPDTRISTLSLYRFADYGVTVRGTPGMEIACFGKPAFTAGTGTYAGLGFTYDSSSIEEFLERLATIEQYGRLPEEMRLRARRYAHTLFTRRPWRTRSFSLVFDIPERGWNPLDRNVIWNVRSLADLDAAGDLAEWADWACQTDEPDYGP
jgi:hypothetical protein